MAHHASDIPFAKWLIKTTHYIQFFIQDDLPKALIHSDLFYNNIITELETGQVTIMDFEETAFWRFMNFNFVRPDKMEKDRYKEIQDLAIHVMNISAEKFLCML